MRLTAPLFAPADAPRKIARALASPADAVILDLEDSVAPAAKDAARAGLAAALAGVLRPGVVVRVNPPGTSWYLPDLVAAVAARAAAIMLPKCAGPRDLDALDRHLEALEVQAGLTQGAIGVLPIVTETAAAAARLFAEPPRNRRVRALCFGAEDLSADLGIDPRDAAGRYPAPVAAARAAVLLAAAGLGVPALDTPWPDPRDKQGLAREVAEAARDGFAGKLCIHPDQVAPVQAGFAPRPEQRDWAARVLAAAAASPGAGVFTLDGRMIDRPHLRLAERILALETNGGTDGC